MYTYLYNKFIEQFYNKINKLQKFPMFPFLTTCIDVVNIIHQSGWLVSLFFLNQGWALLMCYNHQSPQFILGFILMK